eukprot:RCo001454
MDAIVLLVWALENLPAVPEFEKGAFDSTRYTAWIFPGFENYSPAAHFRVGTEMSVYEFTASSRVQDILGNTEFQNVRWVYRKEGCFPRVETLVSDEGAKASIAEALQEWDQSGSQALPGGSYDVEGGNGEMWLQSHVGEWDGESRLELLHAPLATVFHIENSRGAPLAALSLYPKEDELLFPPLSRFQVSGLRLGAPKEADQVYWTYVGGLTWKALVNQKGGVLPTWPTSEEKADEFLVSAVAFVYAEPDIRHQLLFDEYAERERFLLEHESFVRPSASVAPAVTQGPPPPAGNPLKSAPAPPEVHPP